MTNLSQPSYSYLLNPSHLGSSIVQQVNSPSLAFTTSLATLCLTMLGLPGSTIGSTKDMVLLQVDTLDLTTTWFVTTAAMLVSLSIGYSLALLITMLHHSHTTRTTLPITVTACVAILVAATYFLGLPVEVSHELSTLSPHYIEPYVALSITTLVLGVYSLHADGNVVSSPVPSIASCSTSRSMLLSTLAVPSLLAVLTRSVVVVIHLTCLGLLCYVSVYSCGPLTVILALVLLDIVSTLQLQLVTTSLAGSGLYTITQTSLGVTIWVLYLTLGLPAASVVLALRLGLCTVGLVLLGFYGTLGTYASGSVLLGYASCTNLTILLVVLQVSTLHLATLYSILLLGTLGCLCVLVTPWSTVYSTVLAGSTAVLLLTILLLGSVLVIGSPLLLTLVTLVQAGVAVTCVTW